MVKISLQPVLWKELLKILKWSHLNIAQSCKPHKCFCFSPKFAGGCNSLHSRVIFEIRVRVHQCFSDKKGEWKKKEITFTLTLLFLMHPKSNPKTLNSNAISQRMFLRFRLK